MGNWSDLTEFNVKQNSNNKNPRDENCLNVIGRVSKKIILKISRRANKKINEKTHGDITQQTTRTLRCALGHHRDSDRDAHRVVLRPVSSGTRPNTCAMRGLFACLLWGMTGGALNAQADQLQGVGLSFSRVVMMEERRGGATVDVNNNTSNVYLMQSQVLGADVATGMPVALTDGAVPFLVLPPLKRLDAQVSLPLRIVASPEGTAKLPHDRESVFFLSTKAIPSLSEADASNEGKDGKGRVAIALVNNIKLFWRPKGLKSEAIGNVANTLSFSRDGDRLTVTNPSGYYLTFSSLKVSGQAVPAEALRAMVPPRGTQNYPLPRGATGSTASWTLIDEYGLPTKEQQDAVR